MNSFVVPAHNEALYLGRTLQSIGVAAEGIGGAYEVIVVDDDSTDATARVASEHGVTVHAVALRQIAAVRNAGARAARGDRLFFVDADTVINAATLGAAVRALDAGAVGGGATVRFEGRLPLWARLFVPPTVAYLHSRKIAAGCFLFCTRQAFHAVGGFDEALYASEEITMSQALGRHGEFVILPETVQTSGRKLRTYSGSYHLRTVLALLTRGPRSLRQREGLELWYDGRREDADRVE